MIELPVARTYAPVGTLMLYLTDGCNLDCRYCFVRKESRRMSSETARKTVEWFLNRNVSGTEFRVRIVFFGGEPFLALDRMEEVVLLGRQRRPGCTRKVSFSATTNGTIASPRVERILRDAEMDLFISLDGGAEATAHRPFVSGRSSYSVVARNLPKLVRWAHQASVRMTFHPGSLDLVGSVRRALELGAPQVALCPVVEADWKAWVEPLEAAYEALADEFLGTFRRGTPLPLIHTWQLLGRLHRDRTAGDGKPTRPCTCAHSLLGVDPDGNVMPCHRFLYRPGDWLGTVDRPELSPAREPYVAVAARDVPGCDRCPADRVCGGGCRYLALAGTGDLHGKHPGHCLTLRAHFRAVERIYTTLMEESPGALLRALARPAALQELVG